MATVTMTLEEYEALIALIRQDLPQNSGIPDGDQAQLTPKPKKRSTAYGRRYKKAFKKVKSRYMTKSGKWKKGGFKAAVRAAHKEARK